MNKRISDINVREGWTMQVQNGDNGPFLIVKQNAEFDLFTVADVPYFEAPIRIGDALAPYVNIDTFVTRGTTVPLEEAIVWIS